MARLANSLITLRDQVNKLSPKRSKVNDGWIGDTAHQSRHSDHNPNSRDVVQALDITHDYKNFDAYKLAEVLQTNKDNRIKYVISNKKIFSSTVEPWRWRLYGGINPHDQHTHISVRDNPKIYDDNKEWNLSTMTPEDNKGWNKNITATVFGGSKDSKISSTSAYDGHLINDTELGVALPYKFNKPAPKVEVRFGNKTAIAPVVDVGPWNTDNPYWETMSRPQAESGKDSKGRKTNKAGIDLTPGLAKQLGLPGKGKVDWRFPFVEEKPVITVDDVPVKSPWYSKINWAQATAMLSSAILWASQGKINIPTDIQLQIALAIPVVFGGLTIIFRTWFNNTVTK